MTKVVALALILVFCAALQAQDKQCFQLKRKNHIYGYSLTRGRKKSVRFPLLRIGTQTLERDLGRIRLYNRNMAIIELIVNVKFPEGSNDKATLVLDEIHTLAGCADETINDCVTNVPENEYPMWAICKEFLFTLKPTGLELEMKLEGMFLVVSVEGDLVGKVALPPIGCTPQAPRHTITRIAYSANTSLVHPFICN